MMFRAISLFPVALLLGCHPDSDPQSEADVAFLREVYPEVNQYCVDLVASGGIEAFPQDVRKCFPMEESKRWAGLWLDEFEGSRFCADPAEECTFDSEGERVWLSFAEEIRREAEPDRVATDQLYRIEFVGRQTAKSGAFGHMGGSDKEIVVEELIRLEMVSES